MSIYTKEIMEHFRNPKNVGRMKNPSGLGRAGNMVCGDIMYLYLKIIKDKNNREIIKDVKFETFGCTVAIANTSLLTTMVKGKTLEAASKITKEDLIKKFKQVPLIKIHCSMLAVDALAEATYDYFVKNKKPISPELQARHERIQKEEKEIEHKHSELVGLEEELHKNSMDTKDLYKKFSITPNLADHMLTVAKVVLFIKNHWKGESLDWEKLEKAALLHDIGNIVKFDLNKYPKFLGKEKNRLAYWKKKQKQIIEKYGGDDHEATKAMLCEARVEKDIIKIILQKSFGNSIQTAASTDWHSKILLYADLRVLPDGVATLKDRFKDIEKRMPQYTNRPDFNNLLRACKNIENQIQEKLDILISKISNSSISEREC